MQQIISGPEQKILDAWSWSQRWSLTFKFSAPQPWIKLHYILKEYFWLAAFVRIEIC